MVICSAVNCSSNTSNKNRVKGISLYRLPSDENIKKKWLTNLKRENLPNDIRICHLHFEESCFKRDLEVKIYYDTIFCYTKIC